VRYKKKISLCDLEYTSQTKAAKESPNRETHQKQHIYGIPPEDIGLGGAPLLDGRGVAAPPLATPAQDGFPLAWIYQKQNLGHLYSKLWSAGYNEEITHHCSSTCAKSLRNQCCIRQLL
jgi:hypothetical protein